MSSKISNEIFDEENDDIEDKAYFASDDEVDFAPSASFNFDDPDDVNGDDQKVKGDDENASNSTGTTQQRQITCDKLIYDVQSALNEQIYNPVNLQTTKKIILVFWKIKSLQITYSNK